MSKQQASTDIERLNDAFGSPIEQIPDDMRGFWEKIRHPWTIYYERELSVPMPDVRVHYLPMSSGRPVAETTIVSTVPLRLRLNELMHRNSWGGGRHYLGISGYVMGVITDEGDIAARDEILPYLDPEAPVDDYTELKAVHIEGGNIIAEHLDPGYEFSFGGDIKPNASEGSVDRAAKFHRLMDAVDESTGERIIATMDTRVLSSYTGRPIRHGIVVPTA